MLAWRVWAEALEGIGNPRLCQRAVALALPHILHTLQRGHTPAPAPSGPMRGLKGGGGAEGVGAF
jgi:hypothetical protein